MKKEDELLKILVSFMAVEAKHKYDLGFADGNIPTYNGEFLGDMDKGPKAINGASNNCNNYPIGANPKRGGFRR